MSVCVCVNKIYLRYETNEASQKNKMEKPASSTKSRSIKKLTIDADDADAIANIKLKRGNINTIQQQQKTYY